VWNRPPSNEILAVRDCPKRFAWICGFPGPACVATGFDALRDDVRTQCEVVTVLVGWIPEDWTCLQKALRFAGLGLEARKEPGPAVPRSDTSGWEKHPLTQSSSEELQPKTETASMSSATRRGPRTSEAPDRGSCLTAQKGILRTSEKLADSAGRKPLLTSCSPLSTMCHRPTRKSSCVASYQLKSQARCTLVGKLGTFLS